MSLASKQHIQFRAIFFSIVAAENKILLLAVLLGKRKLHSQGACIDTCTYF